MPHTGQRFHNPTTGEQVEFLETGAETSGRYVRFRSVMPQGKGFEVEHLHPYGDETFEVVSGTLSVKLDGKYIRVPAGESIELPRNRPHAHWNADAEDLVVIQTILPCLDVDRFLENLFGLAMDGRLDAKGQPPFLQVLVWIRHLKNKTYLAALPRGVQDALAFMLSPLAHLLGYRPFYEKYSQ